MGMRNSDYHFKFEELNVYQKAIEYGEMVNTLIDKFPQKELYKLSSQFGRAADSIALNISEGSSGSDANFNRYLNMARDSANECVTASTKARLRKYITFEEDEENRKQLTEILKMINALIRHLKNK